MTDMPASSDLPMTGEPVAPATGRTLLYRVLCAALPGLAIGAAMGGWAYACIGAGVAVVFAIVTLLIAFAPLWACASLGWANRAATAAGVLVGSSCIALFASSDVVPVITALACMSVGAAGVLAGLGLLAGLEWLTCKRWPAGPLVCVLMLAWLTAPVWLSPAWAGHRWLPGAISRIHPVLAVDGLLVPFDRPLSEREFFYFHLGNLNQDVPYSPPATVWVSMLSHILVGAGLALPAISVAWRRRRAMRR